MDVRIRIKVAQINENMHGQITIKILRLLPTFNN